MKIAVNASSMNVFRTGMNEYIAGLIENMQEADHKNNYDLFLPSNTIKTLKEPDDNFRYHKVPSNRPLRIIWEQTILPLRLRQLKTNILHSLTFVCPLIKTCKNIITILDMTFFILPKHHTIGKRNYFRSMIPLSIKNADKIIAVSESTKKDIMDILRVDSSKIEVIHLGYNAMFRSIDKKNIANTVQKYCSGSKYLLYVGTLEPRKNVQGLIKAYNALDNKIKSNHVLLIVGRKGWGYDQIFKTAEEVGSSGKVVFTGHVTDQELVALYNGAEAVVYPSLYEGFGLPILEAMACGTPVITSNISSMPEIAGDAAQLVDPNDVHDIKQAIEFLLNNRSARTDLINKGYENIKRFSYRKMAEETLRLYKKVAL